MNQNAIDKINRIITGALDSTDLEYEREKIEDAVFYSLDSNCSLMDYTLLSVEEFSEEQDIYTVTLTSAIEIEMPTEMLYEIPAVIHEANIKSNFVKFYFDGEQDCVIAEYDFILSDTDAFAKSVFMYFSSAHDLMHQIDNILNHHYECQCEGCEDDA